MSTIIPGADSSETCRLLAATADGDRSAFSRLLQRHERWLASFAASRLDSRLAARVDPSDVVQETHIHLHQRLDDYLRRRPFSFRTWVLKTAYDRLAKLKRQHLGTECRSMLREVPLDDSSSLNLANQLVSVEDSPWQRLSRAELALIVRRSLARLSEADREVLLLRHIEGLNNQEIGHLLDLQSKTVSKRYGRALLRLHEALRAEGFQSDDS
jgi:RNA polymerase sigma-70 factor (ECF subfamily)